MNEYINIATQVLIMVIAYLAFNSQSKKDKNGDAVKLENRINTIEIEQKQIKQDLHKIADSIDLFRSALSEITTQIKMFSEIKDSLKDFSITVQSINRTVAEHGIEIKNLKENINDL